MNILSRPSPSLYKQSCVTSVESEGVGRDIHHTGALVDQPHVPRQFHLCHWIRIGSALMCGRLSDPQLKCDMRGHRAIGIPLRIIIIVHHHIISVDDEERRRMRMVMIMMIIIIITIMPRQAWIIIWKIRPWTSLSKDDVVCIYVVNVITGIIIDTYSWLTSTFPAAAPTALFVRFVMCVSQLA